MSQGMVQMPLPSVYLALGLRTAYSLILCLLTSGGVDSDVTGSGDDDGLALEGLSDGLEHLVGEVAQSVSGGLGPGEGSAGSDGLSGEDSGEVVPHPLVLAVHESDLPSADSDVTGGDVGVGSDVPLELGHEGLAEAHDLGVGLALGVEMDRLTEGWNLSPPL